MIHKQISKYDNYHRLIKKKSEKKITKEINYKMLRQSKGFSFENHQGLRK
jgi:hypothetical protein